MGRRSGFAAQPPRLWSHRLDIGSTLLSFVVTVAVQIWSVPVLLATLGARQFSIFQVIVALLGWSVLMPLGFDRALKNRLSTSRAQGEAWTEVLSVARSLVWILFLVLTLVILLFGEGLGTLLLSSLAGRIEGGIFSIALVAILLFGIGNIGREILFGARRGRWVSAVQIASMTAVLFLLAIFHYRAESVTPDLLLALALVMWLAPHAVAGIAALALSGTLRATPSHRLDNYSTAPRTGPTILPALASGRRTDRKRLPSSGNFGHSRRRGTLYRL